MTLTNQRRAQVAELWEAGVDIPDIAAALCVPESRVAAIVDTYDVPHDFPQRVVQEMSKSGHVRSQAAAGGDPDLTARLRGKGPRRKEPNQPTVKRVPAPAAVSERLPRDERFPFMHGTITGYKRHSREHSRVCEPCAQAKREHNKTRARTVREIPVIELQPCGTMAAYNRHHARGEPIDDQCREAARLASERKRKARRSGQVAEPKPTAKTQIRHGTTSGYRRGCRCDDCTDAHRDRCAEYRASRKEQS